MDGCFTSRMHNIVCSSRLAAKLKISAFCAAIFSARIPVLEAAANSRCRLIIINLCLSKA